MSAAVVVGVAAATAIAAARQQPAPQRAQGTVRAGITAVLVDVVVHDKKGEPVRDIEGGASSKSRKTARRRPFASFTMVMDGKVPAPRAGVAASATPLGSRPAAGAAAMMDAGPTVTALVFDRLAPESRKLAVQAAQNYLGTRSEAPGYVGIFGIDLALSPYAPFTRDLSVLKAGLDKMAQRATSTSNSKDAREKAVALEQAADAASAGAAAAEASSGPGGSNVGTGTGDAMLAQMQANMIRGFDSLERDQLGYSTTNGLFAIIEQMRRLPGRKSLVFFSEGMTLPTAVQPPVSRRDRRGQSCQRRHLHDGRRRSPRRERAGEHSRSSQQGGRRRRRDFTGGG